MAGSAVILRELHRKRNHLPYCGDDPAMLASVRAHAAFAFHNGGPRRLANLHRIAELARQADAGARSPSAGSCAGWRRKRNPARARKRRCSNNVSLHDAQKVFSVMFNQAPRSV